MNRRGQIATLLLWVSGLLLIGMSAFVFASFNDEIVGKSSDLHVLISNLDFKESYVRNSFYDIVSESVLESDKNNFEMSFNSILRSKASEKRDAYFGNFYGKIVNGEYVIEKSAENYEITVKDVLINSEVGKNEITRSFDISLRFNEKAVEIR